MAYAQRIFLLYFHLKSEEDIQNVYIDVVHQYICVVYHLYIRCLKIHQTKCHITYSMVGKKKKPIFFLYLF